MCPANLANSYCALQLSGGGVVGVRVLCYGDFLYGPLSALALFRVYSEHCNTPYEYHGSTRYAMDHANFRRRNRPQEYESPLVCLGPIYQSEPSRADHVERPPYAQKQPSCITTYRSQPSLRTAVKKALTAHEAQNTGPTSNRRVSKPSRWRESKQPP